MPTCVTMYTHVENIAFLLCDSLPLFLRQGLSMSLKLTVLAAVFPSLLTVMPKLLSSHRVRAGSEGRKCYNLK